MNKFSVTDKYDTNEIHWFLDDKKKFIYIYGNSDE